MASRDGPSGGTGFLFGNIDRKGRLDEEYLDDDAKDNLDNVGAKVVNDNDDELREIEALPLKSAAAAERDEDDRVDADDRVDYYDEPDVLDDGLDDAERHDMAAVALRRAASKPSADDDDENYDDDDDGDDPAASASAPATAASPSDGLRRVPSLPSAARSSAPASAAAAARPRPSAPAEDPALVEQRRLMAAARAAVLTPLPEAPPPPPDPDVDVEDEPLPFTKMFSRPRPALRYRPRQRRYGFVPPAVPPARLRVDDADALERRPSPPVVDPAAVVLALDAAAAALRKPPRRQASREVRRPHDDAYREAAQPLDEHGDSESVDEAEHALVQQVAWEDAIVWKDDADDDDDPWWTSDMENESARAEAREGKPDATEDGDDDDDDDDEFEDPVVMNLDKPPEEASGKDAEDSDDDMEWEDGELDEEKKAEEKAPEKPSEKKHVSADVKVKQEPKKLSGKDERKVETKTASKRDRASGKEKTESKARDGVQKEAKQYPGRELIDTVIAPNRDLAEGSWVHAIAWDSQSESESDAQRRNPAAQQARELKEKFSRLILDMNDPNMIFEHLSDDTNEAGADARSGPMEDRETVKAKMKDLIFATGTQVHQLLEADRFNISNDLYYARGASNHRKVDRRYVLRGLQNAPPATKCQTTKTVIPDSELLSFRRPKLTKDNLPQKMKLQPFRRKRPKGGHAQIAGQIPKRKNELLCSEKDAYRVSLYEYPLERQPPIMLIPGMASRIVSYQRKRSAAEAQQASKDAAGTAEADTVFMSPDEAPPVAAGDIQADEKPLSVLESHILSAPCVKTTTPTTDFLLVRHGKSMYVREIDSVVSVGVTEPKVEAMAPNTERYKKYTKDRVYLWILREYARQEKELVKAHKKGRGADSDAQLRDPPYIVREEIWREFWRRRTYPEGSLTKLLKDMARYQNGRYLMAQETGKGTAGREAEFLRTLNPMETAAYEAMEGGWEHLMQRGVRQYTYPSSQGNILAAADPEKSGFEAEVGPAVATYIKCHLLKTPWYVASNKIAVQRAQRKELLSVLSLARIVNDLREGGSVMESRLMSLTAAEMTNVLSNHYKLNAKKIPDNVEERRELVREMSQRKTKSTANDVSDYSQVIANVLKKHRDAGLGKGAAIAAQGTAMVSGTFLGLPLDVQRKALEDGDVDELPVEAEDYYPEKDGEKVYAIAKRVLGKRKERSKAAGEDGQDGQIKQRNTSKKAKASGDQQSSISPSKPPLPHGGSRKDQRTPRGGQASHQVPDDAKKKKKVTRLKLTKKVMGDDGKMKPVVTYVTDPEEIARLMESSKQKKASKKGSGDKGPQSSSGGLKIAIPLNRFTQGNKGSNKKPSGTLEKKKSNKKAGVAKNDDSAGTATVRKISGEKGQIGKIKISTKQLHKDREQAALKRKRSQYGDDIEYRAKKTTKTSRRKRNGTVQLNGILENIEKNIRETEGYIVPDKQPLSIARLRNGESPPPNVIKSNLAMPKGTGLDFTAPVDVKQVPTYFQIVKKPMYLNLIRQKCRKCEYNKASDFVDDVKLMAHNARLFNSSPDVQWVVQHATLLLDVAIEQVSRRVDEIQAAEEMVKLEKAEAKSSGASSKSKKSKGKNKEKKGSSKKIDPKEVVVIADGSDKETGTARSSAPEVVDLNDDGPPLEETPEVQGIAGSPAASPDAGASMLDAGITADDIYAIDRPDTSLDGPQESADNLVLDLDDVGGNEPL